MARPLRIEYEHALYHVTSRGNARAKIFLDDFDRELFLDILLKAHERFRFIVHAFVLMGNHYHFLFETPHANLSASMHHINAHYTQAFNKRHKTVGHLLQGRFKAIVVDREAYYLELIRYINLNPWRAKIVSELDDFNYSSHKAVIDPLWARKWAAWYDRDMLLSNFGRREAEAVRSYRAFVESGKGKESPLKNIIGGYALGDRAFADRLWEKYVAGREYREVSMIKQIRPQIDPSKVIETICKEYGVERVDILKSHRGKIGMNVPRAMALYLLNRNSGLKQREIGDMMGGLSAASVSEMVKRFERIVLQDAKLNAVCDRLLKKIK